MGDNPEVLRMDIERRASQSIHIGSATALLTPTQGEEDKKSKKRNPDTKGAASAGAGGAAGGAGGAGAGGGGCCVVQ